MADDLRAQLPDRCPSCGHDPTGDDEEFTSGGGWVHSTSIEDGIWIERMRCPRTSCRTVVAKTEQRPEGRA